MRGTVRWEDVGPETFENMCAVLISRLNPDARRIDGSGGDGGRDVQISTARGPVIYEMKSFTGRMTPSRRRQVASSAERAKHHEPRSWNLVVPIDPTPAEERWFASLAGNQPFECDWLGRTWLEEKLAAHPDIVRWYLQGSNEEVVEILRELSKEEGALTRGVPDVIERMRRLSNRLEGLDPHYSFGVSIDRRGSPAVAIWPKYPGAGHDRPISIETQLAFPTTAEGRKAEAAFIEALDYGLSSTVPAEYVKRVVFNLPGGLQDSVEAGTIHVSSVGGSLASDFMAHIRVIDQNSRTTAQVPLYAKVANQGRRGSDVKLCDATGTIEAKVRVDTVAQVIQLWLRFRSPEKAFPASLLPALRLMEQLQPPNSVVLLVNGKEVASPVAVDSPLDETLSPTISLLRALDEIQEATGIYFPVPSELSREELDEVSLTRRLLAGETVQRAWTEVALNSTAGALPSLRQAIGRGPGHLVVESEFVLNIGGEVLPVGRIRSVFSKAVVVDWPDQPENAAADTPVEVKLRPGADSRMAISLIDIDSE